MTITIGTDPEVFLRNTDGQIVSAIGHVGGTKYEPIRVVKGAVQEDNVLAEFNTDPASTRDEFLTNIKTVMGQLRERVSPFELAIISSHEFTMDQLLRSGRAALMFGCDPDFDAWTGEKNTPPSPRTVLRTAGGHIHVGFDNPSEESASAVGRRMDLLLGVPSVLLDEDDRRRTMYGKAGAIRYKDYGVEYRSLSNFWLSHSGLIEWAYDQSILAAQTYDQDVSRDVVTCINTGDRAMAERIIKQYGVKMP